MIPLVVDIGLPALILYNILTKFDTKKIFALWQFPVAWFLETVFFFILTIIFSYFAKSKNRREFAVSLFYQNGIFFPIILISQIYGEKSPLLVNLFLFTIFYPTFFFNTCHLFFKNENKREISLFKEIFNLAMLATIIGIFIKFLSLNRYIPDFVFDIFKRVGAMTIPLLMIIIGGNIYLDFKRKVKFEVFENFKFILIKNFAFPLITIAILSFFNLNKDLKLILFLESTVPPITAIPIFVKRAGGNDSLANQFLISSFIVSLVSIPVMFYIYSLSIF